MYANGAQVLGKDGKVAINSKEAAEALDWYLDLFRKHKVCPPSVPTDGWRGIVEGFGRGVTNSYVHNSGSSEEQKDFVKPENFATVRSEEHTSELQSQSNLVCRLLLEKKKKTTQSSPALL